ncbi:MAG: DNA repair protein RecN, partial [Lachnospiraceae bacterium]
ILNVFNREVSAYEQSHDFGEELFYETEKRLNELNHIKSKYGGSIERVLELYEEKKKRYAALQDYEQTLKRLKQESEEALKRYRELAERLSKERTAYAKALSEEIRKNLIDLNFLQVQFEMKVSPKDTITGNGSDEAEFFISTNPGEPLRSLGAVASGGELSRIMLAIKTVLAGKDTVGTLVFDEIDTGISGRTAQMVAEKMAVIAKQHQVICITHLPQIAAMADVHFQIEKTVQHGGTETVLTRLSDEQMIGELTRMLGGAKLTDAVKNSAEEMKRLAEHYK